MCTQQMNRRAAHSLVLAAAAVVGLTPVTVRAQEGALARWLPWFGCWQGSAVGDQTAGPRVCVFPDAAKGGVVMQTVADGKVAVQRTVIADGARHAIAEGGCTGWETSAWSTDGHRVFRRTELMCGTAKRTTSGVLAFLPGNAWVDIEAITVAGTRGMRVVRYGAVKPAADVQPAAGGDQQLAIETSRLTAAAPLTTLDVIDAAAQTETPVLLALLQERGGPFDVSVSALRRLGRENVPGEVTDLMIALSYPQYFAVNRPASVTPATPRTTVLPDPYYGGMRCYPPLVGYPYPNGAWTSYGWQGGYSVYDPCYGWIYGGRWGGWGWYGPYDGPVIVRGGHDRGGRLTPGGGYQPPSGGYTGSGGGSGRSAHPRSDPPSSSGGGYVTRGGGYSSPSSSGSGPAREPANPAPPPSSSSEGGSDGGQRTAHPRGSN